MGKINFTKALIEGLAPPPAGRRLYVYDTKSRGLSLAVAPGGAKSFYVLRKHRGRVERVLVGRFPDTSVEKARKRAGQINGQLDAGLNPNEIKRRERGELTLRDLFADYMSRHAKVHNRRPEKTEYHFKLYFGDVAPQRLSRITSPAVQAWHQRLGAKHGHRSANIALGLLSVLFNRARDWGHFPGDNPTRATHRYKERSRERFMHADEVQRFLRALRQEPDPDARDFFLLLLLTGARKRDVLAMSWKDLNLGSAVWVIPDTKTGDAVTLPLSPPALNILTDRVSERDESAWVFPSRGASGHLVEPKKAWARILKRADIQGLWIHDLRRTLGSWMAAQGANLSVIGKALGHKSLTTTTRYARLNLDPIRLASNAVSIALLGEPNDGPAVDTKDNPT